MSKTKKRFNIRGVIVVAFLTFFVLMQIFPFWISIVQSLQPKEFIVMNTIELWPQAFSINNYLIAWQDADFKV